MDVIAALEAIMHQNTAYYQSDFAYDIKMLREAARSDQPEDKLLLWLSRPSGTFCFRERDVLLKDTQAYNTWKFCGEQTHDRILAYAVELTGAANGTVQGNLYELDYQQHFQHIRDASMTTPLIVSFCAYPVTHRKNANNKINDFLMKNRF